jgi:predicted transposase/invertase (TIGR01784 family)
MIYSKTTTKVKNALDVWLAFLTRNDLLKKDHLPKELDDPSLAKAIDVLDVMNLNADERDAYEGRLKWMRIEANTLKKHGEDCRAEGKAEGIAIGEAKGKAIGRAEIARKMLEMAVDIKLIEAATGLTKDEILTLK